MSAVASWHVLFLVFAVFTVAAIIVNLMFVRNFEKLTHPKLDIASVVLICLGLIGVMYAISIASSDQMVAGVLLAACIPGRHPGVQAALWYPWVRTSEARQVFRALSIGVAVPKLLQSLPVGSLILRNRLVMPPMATEKSEGEGRVSQALLNYYDEKTKSGYFGLVVTEHSYICEEGKASVHQVSFARDEDVPGLAKLAEVIHRNGSRAIAQINHAGGKAICALNGAALAPAPSAMPYTTTRGEAVQARTLTQEEIDAVVSAFAAAARRAKDAGFDGVEVHSAHGYLLGQFYSPLTNKRTDQYSGATVEGRTRLHCQVVAAVRKAVGPDFPIAVRLGACDYLEGGNTVEDAVGAAKILEAAGIDMLDISGGLCGYRGFGSKEEGYFGEEAAAIRSAVGIPVILTGGVRTPEGAERLLEEGKADLVGVGRAVLKDSTWAKAAIEQLGGTPVRGAVFFDYDGTLHNSMAIYGPAFRAAYAWLVEEGHMPLRGFTDEWISQWLGWTTEDMWTTFAPNLPESVWRHAAKIVGREMDRLTEEGQARLFQGVPEVLGQLKAEGYQLAFLSNCRTDYMDVHRKVFGLDRWFDAYYWAEGYGDIPKWQIYQQVCNRHAFPQIMVGDRFHDMEVAMKSDIPFIGCAYGFCREGELEGAAAILEEPKEIPASIEEVLQ